MNAPLDDARGPYGEGLNLRRSERYVVRDASSIRLLLHCQEHGTRVTHNAQLIDLSTHGMKIKVERALCFREVVELELNSERCGCHTRFQADVCWARPCDALHWWVGVALRTPVEFELMNRLAVHGIVDRRRDRRLPQNVPVFVRRELGSESHEGTLLDLSQGGCSVATPVSGEVGERLLITVQDVPEQMATPVLARVCWIRRHQDVHFIGCAFVLTTASAELRKQLSQIELNSRSKIPGRISARSWFTAALILLAFTLGVTAPLSFFRLLSRPDAGPTRITSDQHRSSAERSDTTVAQPRVVEVPPEVAVVNEPDGSRFGVPDSGDAPQPVTTVSSFDNRHPLVPHIEAGFAWIRRHWIAP